MFRIEEICFHSNKEGVCILEGSKNAFVMNLKTNFNHLIRFFIKKDGLSSEELEVKIKINLSNERQLIIPSVFKKNKYINNILNDFNFGESIYVHKNSRGIYYLTKDGIKVSEKEELLKISEWSDDIFSIFILKLLISFRKHKEWSAKLPLYIMEINNLKILFMDKPLTSFKDNKKIEDFLTKQILKSSDYIFVSSFWIKHPIFGYNEIERVSITKKIYLRIIEELKPTKEDRKILEELIDIKDIFANLEALSLYVGIDDHKLDEDLLKRLFIKTINSETAEEMSTEDLISSIIRKNSNSYLRIILEKLVISKELSALREDNISLKEKHNKNIEEIKKNSEKWKENALIEIEKFLKEFKNFFIWK